MEQLYEYFEPAMAMEQHLGQSENFLPVALLDKDKQNNQNIITFNFWLLALPIIVLNIVLSF